MNFFNFVNAVMHSSFSYMSVKFDWSKFLFFFIYTYNCYYISLLFLNCYLIFKLLIIFLEMVVIKSLLDQ
jgi:hypothetical protein